MDEQDSASHGRAGRSQNQGYHLSSDIGNGFPKNVNALDFTRNKSETGRNCINEEPRRLPVGK